MTDAHDRFIAAHGTGAPLIIEVPHLSPHFVITRNGTADDNTQRIIETLDALPVGTVVLDRDGDAWQRRISTGPPAYWAGAFEQDEDERSDSAEVAVFEPLRVLHIPTT